MSVLLCINPEHSAVVRTRRKRLGGAGLDFPGERSPAQANHAEKGFAKDATAHFTGAQLAVEDNTFGAF